MAGPTSSQIDQLNARWWSSDTPGQSMIAVANSIWDAQEERRAMMLRFACLYRNQPVGNLYQLGLSKEHDHQYWGYYNHQVSYNVVASVVDTVLSKIAKNRIRGQFVTLGGDWPTKQKAKKLTQYAEGLQRETRWHEQAQRAYLDAMIWDGGVLSILGDEPEARVRVERRLPHEVLIDEVEALYGKPRHAYTKRYVARDVLLANPTLNPGNKLGRGGKNEMLIRAAKAEDPTEDLGMGARSHDMIPVYVGWRLPSAPGASDGSHLVAIEGGELSEVEKWDRPRFPFQVFRWREPEMGFWSPGLVSSLASIQVEINNLLLQIQESLKFSVPRAFLFDGSQVLGTDINDEIMATIRVSGQAPVFSTAATVHPEVFSHLETLKQQAFEEAGVSQFSATSQKPAGVNASVALQTLQDVEAERHAMPAQVWETSNIRGLETMIDESRRLYAGNVDTQVKALGTDVIEKINWSQVDLPEEQYTLKASPTSIFPQSVAAKLDKAVELFDKGFFTRTEAFALIDHPDMRAATDLSLAEQDHVARTLNQMLETGQYIPPEPFQDPVLAKKLASNIYFQSQVEGAPDDRLQLILTYLSDLQKIERLAGPAPAQPASPEDAPAEAVGGAPPAGAAPDIPAA